MSLGRWVGYRHHFAFCPGVGAGPPGRRRSRVHVLPTPERVFDCWRVDRLRFRRRCSRRSGLRLFRKFHSSEYCDSLPQHSVSRRFFSFRVSPFQCSAGCKPAFRLRYSTLWLIQAPCQYSPYRASLPNRRLEFKCREVHDGSWRGRAIQASAGRFAFRTVRES